MILTPSADKIPVLITVVEHYFSQLKTMPEAMKLLTFFSNRFLLRWIRVQLFRRFLSSQRP